MKGYATGTAEWTELGSGTNTIVTVTRAVEANRTHYITTFEVAFHAGTPNASVEITLLDGATVIWRTNKAGDDPSVREHSWLHGLDATEGNSVSLKVAAAGTDVVVDANLSGFTQ